MSYAWRFTLAAESDMSEAQYHVVNITGDNECGRLFDSADSTMIGILQNSPAAEGRACTVAYLGISKIVAGAAFSYGAPLTCNASGRAVTVSSGDMCFGRAIEAANNNGEVVEAILHPPVRWGAVA